MEPGNNYHQKSQCSPSCREIVDTFPFQPGDCHDQSSDWSRNDRKLGDSPTNNNFPVHSSPHHFDSAIGLSSPVFLHKRSSVVIFTTREKIGIPSKGRSHTYVNPRPLSTALPTCGKPLWRNLWRMWKTPGYQQVFCFFPLPAPAVEKPVIRFS